MRKKGRRRRSQPQAVGAVVGRVLGDLGLDAAAAAFQIGERWQQIAGAEAAEHCRPVAVRSGTLEVVVDSPVWVQQLQLRRPQLLAALREQLAEEAPTDLRFRVGYIRRS